MKADHISVVIPVYRAEPNLVILYERLVSILDEQRLTFELIFVEDCGGDRSWELIVGLAGRDDRVRGIRMNRNYGQHNAILAGVRAAKGSVIVTIDDDLQHPPEEIPQLLAKLRTGFDVVYGAPVKQQHGFYRDIASKITKLALQGAMGAKNAENISAFRAFSTELRNAFERVHNPNINIDVLLTWATSNFGVCQVRHEPRLMGESGYGKRKLIRHAFNMITGFSTLPLKIAGLIGLLLAFFGVCILVYVVLGFFLSSEHVQGFPFLASIIAIFSGAQLVALGLLGEYLGRIHQRTMDKPAYFFREHVGQ